MRLAIYIKDVEKITGRTYRAAKYYLSKVRKHYGKQRHHILSINEFCAYSGISREEVEKHIK